MKTLVEGKFGHGAVKYNAFSRKWKQRKRIQPHQLASAPAPFDWSKGYDARDTIGPITIKNQGQSDSCAGQAAAYLLEIFRRFEGINEGAISAKSIYSNIYYPGGGTTTGALETQIGSNGANLEIDVPSYDMTGNPLSEQDFEDTSWKTSDLIKKAFLKAGYLPINVPIDKDSVAAYANQYKAVIWMIQGQNGNGWLTANPTPPSRNNPNSLWQHYMCVFGADVINGQDKIKAPNSWGTEVGDNGVQYFGQDYFDSGHILDCFTFVKSSPQVIQQAPPLWQSALQWLKDNLGIGSSSWYNKPSIIN